MVVSGGVLRCAGNSLWQNCPCAGDSPCPASASRRLWDTPCPANLPCDLSGTLVSCFITSVSLSLLEDCLAVPHFSVLLYSAPFSVRCCRPLCLPLYRFLCSSLYSSLSSSLSSSMSPSSLSSSSLSSSLSPLKSVSPVPGSVS